MNWQAITAIALIALNVQGLIGLELLRRNNGISTGTGYTPLLYKIPWLGDRLLNWRVDRSMRKAAREDGW